jgi:catechol 2,3-dioxygenase-like lactoylglutathione lyase family enzyme
MRYEAINTLDLAANDPTATAAAYERLGLRLTPNTLAGGSHSFRVGRGSGAVTALLRPGDNAGLSAVALRVTDLHDTLRSLASHGIAARSEPLPSGRGEQARLPLSTQAGADLILVQSDRPAAADPPAHAFPLKRLDHLAAVAHDLDATTRFWVDVLGVPVTGEVLTPAMVIRQLAIGDAIMELLGPTTPDGHIHRRPPGLVSMAAWEVEDLAAAVAQARAAGFTVPDPATGILPGTRTAIIPAAELGGTAMQLLEYVGRG